MNTSPLYSSHIVCPAEVMEAENSFHAIPKTLNDKTASTVKQQHEHVICNESIEHSASSNSSVEALHKGRGRKPAPPPPSKINNTSVNSIHDHQRTQIEVQKIKSSEDVSNFQESKKLPTCKSLSENVKLKQTIKSFGKKHTKLSPFTAFGCRFSCCGKEHGNFLVTLYMFVKFSYLSNVIGQIYLMQYFIGTKYTVYGAQVLIDLIKGQEWQHSGHFPRVTFCDLEAKKLGKNHVYTLQCVLPLNMFLEKIYIFLWFWHVLITCINLISFIVWFYRIYWPKSRIKFIMDYLKVLNLIPINKELKTKIKIEEFINYYLGLDGLFVIRLITSNCGILLAGELTAELWKSYQNLCIEQINTAEPTYICINKTNFTMSNASSADNKNNRSMHDESMMHCLNTVEQCPMSGTMNPYFWSKQTRSNTDGEAVNHIGKDSNKHQPLQTVIHVTNEHILSNNSSVATISHMSTNDTNQSKPMQTQRSHFGRLGNSSDDIV
ncbi:unnamed protein product [Schistosoma turkestanicum]|nr:unnamed protein product [Schistosoma turkestanicum]